MKFCYLFLFDNFGLTSLTNAQSLHKDAGQILVAYNRTPLFRESSGGAAPGAGTSTRLKTTHHGSFKIKESAPGSAFTDPAGTLLMNLMLPVS